MSGFHQPESRKQLVMYRNCIDDAIPDNAPVRVLDHVLSMSQFDSTFRDWEAEYDRQKGKPPFHPRWLTLLYLYGMMSKVRSSRQLEEACQNRIDFMWLMAGQLPKHSTIAAFAKKNGARLKEVFRRFLMLCAEAELVSLKAVSIDGTTIQADASKASVKTAEKIEELQKAIDQKIEALEAEWKRNEAQTSEALLIEDEISGPKGDYKQKLAELEAKRKKLERATENINRRRDEARKNRPPAPINSTTDPDSRTMKDKEGQRRPSYNAQVAVDTESGLIVGETVNDKASDSGQLTSMVEIVEENCEARPEAVLADAAYNTGPDLARMEELGVEAYMPDSGSRGLEPLSPEALEALSVAQDGGTLTLEQEVALPQRGGRIDKQAFVYDAETDTYLCPAGKSLPRTKRGQDHDLYGPIPDCQTCPLAELCYRAANKKAKGRSIRRDEYESQRERQRQKMSQPEAKVAYAKRAPTVEGTIGHLKNVLGFRRFLRRGIEGVAFEWTLACLALNMKKLIKSLMKLEEAQKAA